MTNTAGSPRKTYDDYMNSPDDGLRYEIIDGEFVINPACSLKHQLVLGELATALYHFAESNQMGEVLLGPVEIRLETDLVVQPDLAFVRSCATSCTETERGTFGPPTIIFEVAAPWTAHLDYERKRRIYESHGVEEYWILDPDLKSGVVLSLQGNRYEPTAQKIGELRSEALPGFSVDLGRVFREGRWVNTPA